MKSRIQSCLMMAIIFIGLFFSLPGLVPAAAAQKVTVQSRLSEGRNNR